MRGYRYQLAAVLAAALVFIASVALRLSQPAPLPPSTPPAPPSATAAIESVAALPTSTPVSQPPTSPDGIPTFREGLVGDVQRLNPLFSPANAPDRDIAHLIFEGLTTTNAFGEPVPALAKSWVISSDGLEYILFLRDDVLWQDGTPFTATDVLYTMSLLRSPDFPGPEALGTFWQTVETEQLGEHIVRFRLTQPLGVFLDRLQIGILPEHALRGIGAAQLASHPFNLTPIGTGPYQLEQMLTDGERITEVRLRAAPNYRNRLPDGGRLPTERVAFRLYPTFDDAVSALEAGQVDGLSALSREQRQPLFMAANNASLDMHNQIENVLGVLLFNWQSESAPFFRDQRVRVALAAGLDRSSVIERTLSGAAIPADSPLMPGSWAYEADLPWPAYDPAYARELLQLAAERATRLSGEDAADATPAGDGSQIAPGAQPTATASPTPPPAALFTFSILVPDEPALVSLAQEIATQWSQLGVAVSVDAVALADYQQRLEQGLFDTVIVEYGLGDSADPDVYAFWNQGQYPDGENYSGVDDRRISVLLERARRDSWGINRAQAYDQFQREFADRVVALPLYYPIFSYVTNPRVDGIQLGFIGTPADRFREIERWRLLTP